jgi:hypothetical protein
MNSNRINNNKNFRSENDINNIINNVHNNISLNHNDDDGKIETLSISYEEITSIIFTLSRLELALSVLLWTTIGDWLSIPLFLLSIM